MYVPQQQLNLLTCLPCNNGLRSDVVGKTFSFADNDTKNAKGTSQRHNVK